MRRRRFLRGTGVCLSLPFLGSLSADSRLESTAAPLRTAFLHFPNGVWEADWVPQSTGPNYELSKTLAPISDIKADVLTVTGLDQPHSRTGDGHYAKTANFLTGMPVHRTEGRDISAGGISVDQLLSKAWQGTTPVPSLTLGADSIRTGVDRSVGYTRIYASCISWESTNRPVTPIISPKAAYRVLFGGLEALPPHSALLLDRVLEDAKRVREKLGRDDRPRMDEYLDSVRAIEAKIDYLESTDKGTERKSGRVVPIEPNNPATFADHAQIMLDLLVSAFQSDTTRVSSLMLGTGFSNVSFSFLPGIHGEHHELSHHENRKEKIEQYQKINQWYVELFVSFVKRLKAIPEGTGTLLDSCLVLFGSGMSDGNRHDPGNLPILLAGGRNASVPLGQHLHFENGTTPLCNLYVSMLNSVGVPTTQFGCSNGKVF